MPSHEMDLNGPGQPLDCLFLISNRSGRPQPGVREGTSHLVLVGKSCTGRKKAFQRSAVWIYTMCVGMCMVMYVGMYVGNRPGPTYLITGVIFVHCSLVLPLIQIPWQFLDVSFSRRLLCVARDGVNLETSLGLHRSRLQLNWGLLGHSNLHSQCFWNQNVGLASNPHSI